MNDTEFKGKIIRILTKLENGTEELMKNFYKVLESKIKNQADLKNIITEMKIC